MFSIFKKSSPCGFIYMDCIFKYVFNYKKNYFQEMQRDHYVLKLIYENTNCQDKVATYFPRRKKDKSLVKRRSLCIKT